MQFKQKVIFKFLFILMSYTVDILKYFLRK